MATHFGDGESARLRVHLALSTSWRDVVAFYRAGEYDDPVEPPRPEMPTEYAAGDVVVHVVRGRELAVVNIEELTAGSDDGPYEVVEHERSASMGLSIRAIERRLNEPLPDAPATLDADAGQRLLDAIEWEYRAVTPWYLTDTHGCLERVQHGEFHGDSWARDMCVCCGTRYSWTGEWQTTRALDWHLEYPDDAQPSNADPVADDELLCLSDAAARVCAACHAILHAPFAPSVEELMYASRPQCPQCEEQRTDYLAWGMPAGPPPPGVRLMGCEISLAVGIPDCECTVCGHQWNSDGD